MNIKPNSGQYLLFVVAAAQLTIVGTYVFAVCSNGVDDGEMLPLWANILMLNGSLEILALLVWLMFPGGGGQGRSSKHKPTRHTVIHKKLLRYTTFLGLNP
ncbi:MAG: hypothetical protein KAX57_02120 [Rhodoferax sp.]|nr:hypothetical protein [Rhodoferax sp.]